MSERTKKIVLPIAILAVGFLATMVMIKARKPVRTEAPTPIAPLVRVVEASPAAHQLIVRANGTVSPRTESDLVSEVAGQVLRIAPAFAGGGFFEKGDVILEVDPVDYELAVVSARSDVAQARVRYESEQAQAELAQEEWAELGDGTASELASRQLQLEGARTALAAAKAALRQAQRNLERTRIRAPFACRVRDKLVDVGRYVTPGVPVARIYAIDYVEIRLPIPDHELAHLDLPVDYRGDPSNSTGPPVKLSAQFAGQRREWRGRIVRVEGEIDPVTRMVNVVAQVDNPYARVEGRSVLPVGLFVEAEILGRTLDHAVALPRTALRGRDEVLVVDREDRLRFRSVEIAQTGRDEILVTGGLETGDRVCISTMEAVTDGMRVRTEAETPDTTDAAANATNTDDNGSASR